MARYRKKPVVIEAMRMPAVGAPGGRMFAATYEPVEDGA